MRAQPVPGPTELLPGCPDAVVDLQSAEGCALVGAQWFTGGAAGSGCAGPIGTAASAYPNAAYDC